MSLPEIDTEYLLSFLSGLLNTPSPTGLAEPGVAYTERAFRSYPELVLARNRKGALIVTWQAPHNESPRTLSAHVDTLGAMVKQIKPNGRLMLTKIGGYAWNTVEGEGCTVFCNQAEPVGGNILFELASGHVHGSKVNETKREDENMEVRLDARSNNKDETEALGIGVGDFCFQSARGNHQWICWLTPPG